MAYVITNACDACGLCVDVCGPGAIDPGDIYEIDPDLCTDCGSCAEVCDVAAITPG